MSIRDYRKKFERAVMEIYFLYRDNNGVYTRVSGWLERKDSTKMSRQISPTDARRDNFYQEILEVHLGLATDSPELEAEIWKILERERSSFIKPSSGKQDDNLMKIFHKLGVVMENRIAEGTSSDLEKDSFELVKMCQNFYESVKNSKPKT